MLEKDLTALAEKAQKFLAQFDGPDWHTPGELYDDCLNWEECEFIAACSPELVLAAMNLIAEARDCVNNATFVGYAPIHSLAEKLAAWDALEDKHGAS